MLLVISARSVPSPDSIISHSFCIPLPFPICIPYACAFACTSAAVTLKARNTSLWQDAISLANFDDKHKKMSRKIFHRQQKLMFALRKLPKFWKRKLTGRVINNPINFILLETLWWNASSLNEAINLSSYHCELLKAEELGDHTQLSLTWSSWRDEQWWSDWQFCFPVSALWWTSITQMEWNVVV